MHFSSRILRPPYEARSKYLQVTGGCSHNKCTFCTYYKNTPFTISSLSQIKKDLQEYRDENYSFKRIWLQSANPFILPTDKLIEIAELIHEYLPFVQSIGGYARVDDLKDKSIEDLSKLKELGYNSITFGVESCDDNLLKLIKKGYNARDVIKQVSKMDKAGLTYTLIFLLGLGGHNYGTTHAKITAKEFNKLHPERIMIQALTPFKDTPLMNKIESGKYCQSTEKEKLMELKVFIRKLEINTFIDATNASILTPFFAKIPENKDKIIEFLEKERDYDLLEKKRKNILRV